jgi:exonuclease VII small subunit
VSVDQVRLDQTEKQRLNDLWQVADRAGLHRCAASLDAAVLEYQQALTAKREAEAETASAQADYDDAAAIAEMTVARQIVRESNKTFIPDPESADGRRQVTADEAKTWVAREVAADDDVRAALSHLRSVQTRLEEARDRIATADRRISAAKHGSDAAVALTNLLAIAFREGRQ